MTVPGRREAARLLLSLEPPAWSLRHACAVADVAAWLAARVTARGLDVDRRAVEAAALLHDVDKLPSAGADGRLRHGERSAAWLEARGLPELASLVLDHPVTSLAEDEPAARLAAASPEARIVAYADKRAGQQLESMDERFGSWRRRYPSGLGDPASSRGANKPSGRGAARPRDGGPKGHGWGDDTAALVVARARTLERDVCALAGVPPEGVSRLRWSRRALREAASEAARGAAPTATGGDNPSAVRSAR